MFSPGKAEVLRSVVCSICPLPVEIYLNITRSKIVIVVIVIAVYTVILQSLAIGLKTQRLKYKRYSVFPCAIQYNIPHVEALFSLGLLTFYFPLLFIFVYYRTAQKYVFTQSMNTYKARTAFTELVDL